MNCVKRATNCIQEAVYDEMCAMYFLIAYTVFQLVNEDQDKEPRFMTSSTMTLMFLNQLSLALLDKNGPQC